MHDEQFQIMHRTRITVMKPFKITNSSLTSNIYFQNPALRRTKPEVRKNEESNKR